MSAAIIAIPARMSRTKREKEAAHVAGDNAGRKEYSHVPNGDEAHANMSVITRAGSPGNQD